VTLGALAAAFPNTFLDKIILAFSTLGMSLPSFFAAIIIAWLFAFLLADYTGLSMFGSLYSVDDMGRGEFLNLKNIILPALTLGIRPLAVISELAKNSMLDVMQQDYIRTAKAKGLSRLQILFRHILRNALNPIVTAVTSWFASLLAGAVFVEYIFDWKGIGVVIVDGLEKYDFPVVMGALLIICVMLVIINIITDIVYGILDPRIRL
jgi:peptide/nickel transport system permease protein